MKENISKYLALFVSGVFNPFLIPTIGLLLIMSYIPGVEFFSMKLKFVMMVVVFLSTCIMPLIFITLGNLRHDFGKGAIHSFDKALPHLFTAMCAFLGSQFLGKLPIPGIFRIFLLGICLIMIFPAIISFKWKISEHMLAFGGLLGTLLALNFKFGMNFLWLIVGVIIISGIVCSARMYLEKDSQNQLYGGYLMGLMGMFSVIVFIW
jgi:hypothetical protein